MTVRIAQLSDTHFIEADAAPEGGFGYDTAAAFDAVAAQLSEMGGDEPFDLVVVTGDVTDHGRPAQYEMARSALADLPAPVAVTPGNHDRALEFGDGLGGGSVSLPSIVERGAWSFVFVDSNAGVMVDDGAGTPVDPDYEVRLHGNGSLGPVERDRITQLVHAAEGEHVWLWVHHPPGAGIAFSRDDAYDEEWRSLLADLPTVRGIGAGHTHVPTRFDFADRDVVVCPALKTNFDLEAATWLPPGWRSYRFDDDGSVHAEVHFVDDERWPVSPLPRSVAALMRGELTWDEFDEIVARRRARAQSTPSE